MAYIYSEVLEVVASEVLLGKSCAWLAHCQTVLSPLALVGDYVRNAPILARLLEDRNQSLSAAHEEVQQVVQMAKSSEASEELVVCEDCSEP